MFKVLFEFWLSYSYRSNEIDRLGSFMHNYRCWYAT